MICLAEFEEVTRRRAAQVRARVSPRLPDAVAQRQQVLPDLQDGDRRGEVLKGAEGAERVRGASRQTEKQTWSHRSPISFIDFTSGASCELCVFGDWQC